jgi:hypothetical protein
VCIEFYALGGLSIQQVTVAGFRKSDEKENAETEPTGTARQLTNLASGIRSKSRCLSCCTDLHRIAQDAPGKCAVMFGAES